MSRPIQFGIGIAAAGVIAMVPAVHALQNPDPSTRADAWIREQMAARKIPGMSVAVVQDGKIIFERAYGLANVELDVPVTTRTRFIIASTTKAWAATAIMMLVEQGKVGLNQPIGELLPDLPASWRSVPVRCLLS
ncbi:MAG: serine hydrolase domain-containing protein, partial [Gemmatimonadota bacterium]